jgi:hypothetical protein
MNDSNSENSEKQIDGPEKKKQQENIDNAASDRLNTKIADFDKKVEKAKIDDENLDKEIKGSPAEKTKKDLDRLNEERRDILTADVIGSKQNFNRAKWEFAANTQEDPALWNKTKEMSGSDTKVFYNEQEKKAALDENTQQYMETHKKFMEELKEIRKQKKN